ERLDGHCRCSGTRSPIRGRGVGEGDCWRNAWPGCGIDATLACAGGLLRTCDCGIFNLERLLVDRKLNGGGGSLGSEIVHARLEALLSAIKVHGSELAHGWVLDVNVERLALINVCGSVGSHVDDGLL